jgi:hypothetical protein
MTWYNQSKKHSEARLKSLKKKYPLESSTRQIRGSLTRSWNKIHKVMTKKELDGFRKIRKFRGTGSADQFKDDSRREKFRKEILRREFADKSTIDKNDPDLYIFAGISSSGKSYNLKGYVPEKTLEIDNDKYKKYLAQKSKSPLKRFPLAHSEYLHEEAGDLTKRAIGRARREKRDITLDMTFANYYKGKNLINDFKKEDYDVHVLGTQFPAHKGIERATDRFLDPTKEGRFVPLKLIAKEGNQTNENVMKARKLATKKHHLILDTTDYNNIVVVSKKGKWKKRKI